MEQPSWQDLMTEAMQIEEGDVLAAHKLYQQSSSAAISEVQAWMDHADGAASVVEALYGSLVAYTQEVMTRLIAEDPEHGGPEHAFRVGQSYGVSCVVNHMIDRLRDSSHETSLADLDDFSDRIHDEITAAIRDAGMTIELLDAKGQMI